MAVVARWTPEEIEQLYTFIPLYQTGIYMVSAGFTIVFYDYILGLSQEIAFVWRSKFTSGTVIYLANRYALVIYHVFLLLSTVTRETTKRCVVESIMMIVMAFVMHAAQAILVCLRLYAIWNRSLIIAGIVLALYTAPIIIQLFFRPINNIVVPTFDGCFSEGLSEYFVASLSRRIISITLDMTVLVLTWVKTYAIWREAVTMSIEVPVSALLLRDGTLHFSFLFVLSILDIVLTSVKSTYKLDFITIFVNAVRSITISHFIIHLRVVFLDTDVAGNHLQSSFSRFASRVVGNLGAPLEFARPNTSQDDGTRTTLSSPIMSRNPLASGILPKHQDGVKSRDRSPSETGIFRRTSKSYIKFGDLFDDTTYGEYFLAAIHRGDTVDDAEPTPPGSNDAERISLLSSTYCEEPTPTTAGYEEHVIAQSLSPTPNVY